MALYCGIDLHSTNNYVAVLDDDLRSVFEGRLPNDLGRILEVLDPFRDSLRGVVIESTRNWYWLADGLADHGFEPRLANTSAIKQYEGLKYLDDRHDARWLARMLALGILPEGYIYPRDQRPLRDLLRRRAFLVHTRTSQLLAIEAVVEQNTGLRVRATEIKRWTSQEVEAHLEDGNLALAAVSMLAVVQVLTTQIKNIEETVVAQAELRPEFQLLRTARGIGEALALTIMYEVGDIRRFKKVGNFASYCRCVKSERLSNSKRKGSGNKRNGNPYLSWAFTEAAHFATRFEPRAKRFVERKRRQTNAIVAIRALANKMARACYYVMRDQVPFDPERAFA